ncbi:bactofilin family protein [Dethiosulfatarculus sandiegensis]|uniref:Polymer-forming cytoskeletal protein n=1 Tax=Dethiosulfatarculus sandiegensis TaxID=1429043 RepID=A0A0D2JEL9_9BACT|nr:polymer-forming cytoskeletal protein [Dethiosulfatarculus sandiegensis]KIX14081.1 hypothetical protein X474_10630 [Dethiosulfatarculus sandiegensis]
MDSNSLTLLAPGTMVRGDIFSENILVVEGGVEGNIRGNRVLVKSSGWVHGNLACRSLSIEPGGLVDGYIKVAEMPSLPPGKAGNQALPESKEENNEPYSLPLMDENAEGQEKEQSKKDTALDEKDALPDE